jgi:hypothetical protein
MAWVRERNSLGEWIEHLEGIQQIKQRTPLRKRMPHANTVKTTFPVMNASCNGCAMLFYTSP